MMNIHHAKVIVYLWLIICQTILLGTGAAHSGAVNPEAERFLERFKAFQPALNTQASGWLESGSPWAPYLKQQFTKGLSESDRLLSEKLQTQARCEEVLTLEQRGFIALFKNLRWVFRHERVLQSFDGKLVPAFSYAYQRCRARHELVKLIEKEKRKHSGDALFFGRLPNTRVFRERAIDGDSAYARYWRTVYQFIRLAICAEYPPAFRDIEYITSAFHFANFHNAEAYYLTERARQLGVKTGIYDRIMEIMGGGGAMDAKTSLKLYKMRHALKTGDLAGARALIPDLFAICSWVK